MKERENLIGRIFGRLTIVSFSHVSVQSGKKRHKWLCRCECGNMTITSRDNLISGSTKSCGCYQREGVVQRMKAFRTKDGPSNPLWTGGRVEDHRGYFRLYRKEHPNHDCNGYVAEHRIVMENNIGRYLRPEEIVHHIDGNKKNNNISNLVLFPSQREHRLCHLKQKKAFSMQGCTVTKV